MGIATILLANDGSPAGAQALPHAVELARATGARLIGLYIADERLLFHAGIHRGEAEHELSDEAREVLAAMAAAAATAEVAFEGRSVTGRPTAAILKAIDETGAELVVIGSHGGGAVAQLLTGNVAEEVIRQVDVPVLVVPWRSRPNR